MKKYFRIKLEFNHVKLENIVVEKSLEKGYCCFVDSNLLVNASLSRNKEIRSVLNHALVNSCDGSYIAMLASSIYKKKLKAYNGPEFFKKFINYPETQCIIGNTPDVFEKIKQKLSESGSYPDLHYIPTPFLDVDQFDYVEIARQINTIKPRYIWVSLGAPKQEIFMSKLLPHIDKGMMLGVGAALNYFSGTITDIPNWATKFNLIWFYRILTEPKKQISRVMKIIWYYPIIYFFELTRI